MKVKLVTLSNELVEEGIDRAKDRTVDAFAHVSGLDKTLAARYVTARSRYIMAALKQDGQARVGRGYITVTGNLLEQGGAASFNYVRIPKNLRARTLKESEIDRLCALSIHVQGHKGVADLTRHWRDTCKALQKNFLGVYVGYAGVVGDKEWHVDPAQLELGLLHP